MMMTRRIAALATCLTLAACVGEKQDTPPPAKSPDAGQAVKPDAAGQAAKPAGAGKAAAKPAAPKVAAAAPVPAVVPPKAPDNFKVEFVTTVGAFEVEVTRAWSPNGADRFHEMVTKGFYKDIAFFRVINGFMVQFGIHGDPEIASKWRAANIKDDPVKQSNTRGMLTYAKTGMPNSRSSQLFINFGNNANLDGMGFSPFGKVTKGMENVDKIYKVGEGAPAGPGPAQGRIQTEGNAYLKKFFPKLDYIKSARVVQ